MIAMTNKTCNHKQSCCTVTYCHLVSAWATTVHKFQGFKSGLEPEWTTNHRQALNILYVRDSTYQENKRRFEAGCDSNDQFKHLIVDPGNLTTKQQNPGILYAAISRAKTMGQMTPNNCHPKHSAIFWTGLGICKKRVLNITKKRGLDGNITNCLKINKRQEWVNHLLEQSQLTSSRQYSERHKKLSLMENVDLKQAIAEIITNSNENWKKLKREKYKTEKSYFQK
jgi:hypothetical protein